MNVSIEHLKKQIIQAYQNRNDLLTVEEKEAAEQTIFLLDQGKIRVAEKQEEGWYVHNWIKQAILLYFMIRKLEPMRFESFESKQILEFYDKIPIKRDYEKQKVRVVPPGVARYGSFLEPGVILMPGYVNIGAYIGTESMVDTFATVGSCAQIGKHVHLSGGVGIGGVLEPIGATPVIIEDDVFIGSRCIVVEGVRVEEAAVLGANVVLTASTKIFDVTGDEPVLYQGRIPARSVVIPGTIPKQFAAGTYQVPCALIIGKRTESTNQKTSLDEALRRFDVAI